MYHLESVGGEEPVEKAGLAMVTGHDEFLHLQHHDTVFLGVPEMRSLKVRDFGECVRDCRERFFSGHGRERTAELQIAVDANITELLQSQ